MFEDSLARCIELATRERVVLMCAEAVPWRCHRSLIADALIVRRIDAREITSGIRTRPHALTPWALVNDTHVTYHFGVSRERSDQPRGGSRTFDGRYVEEGTEPTSTRITKFEARTRRPAYESWERSTTIDALRATVCPNNRVLRVSRFVYPSAAGLSPLS